MKCFGDVSNESEALAGGQGLNRYLAVIKICLQLSLGIDYLSVGLSFRQAARVLLATEACSELASIGSCSNSRIFRNARTDNTVNHQMVHNLLQKAWTFFIALDIFTQMSTSLLDIWVCLHLNRHGSVNVRLLSAPVYDWHTARVNSDSAGEALNVLCPSWMDTIFGVTTDGEKKRDRLHLFSGAATLFQNTAQPSFICILYGHQLDIALQSVYNKLGDNQLYQQLTALIFYIRRQQNLVAKMPAETLKVADTS